MSANLADLLTRAAAQAPDRVALVDTGDDGLPGRETTWAELAERVDRLAHGLGERGLVAGHRVAVAGVNSSELVVAYLATLRANLVAVPLNPHGATGEMLRMLTDSGARLVIADATTLPTVRVAVEGLRGALAEADDELRRRSIVPHVVTLGAPAADGETELASMYSPRPSTQPPTRDPEALAVLLYTSGASAKPKAAMLTHRALLANLEQAAQVQPPMLLPDDVVLGVLPLFHVYGLNAVLGQVMRAQATLVLASRFDPDETLRLVEAARASVLPLAPSVFGHWLRREDLRERLAGVRLVLSGSAPLAPEVVTEFTERSGVVVHQGYGLTEAAPVVTSTLCSASWKPGSVGAALPGVRLRLADSRGMRPEGADPGEIQVSGDNLFSGYWPDGDGAPVDGWLATGDIGYLDADGDLFLVDRLKEIVIVSGFNVYPVEIEEVLGEVAGVAEAAVVGVPDPETGEAVVAYVSTTPGEDPAAVRRAIDEACVLRLARFKHPVRVEIVDELPHTPTGKVAKGRLRSAQRRQRLGLLE